MPEVLQLAQLVELDRVAQMQVRTSRIESFLDSERLPALQLGDELRLDEQLCRTPLEHRQMMMNVGGHFFR